MRAKRIRPSNFSGAQAKKFDAKFLQLLQKTSPTKLARMTARRGKKAMQKEADKLFAQRQLQAMNLRQIMKKELADLQGTCSPMQAGAMASFIAERQAVKFMDLPETKKRILIRLLSDQTAIIKGMFEQIPTKTFQRIVEQTMERMKAIARTEKMTEQDKKTIDWLKSQELETRKMHGQGTVTLGTGAVRLAAIITNQAERFIGQKNLLLLEEAHRQATEVFGG